MRIARWAALGLTLAALPAWADDDWAELKHSKDRWYAGVGGFVAATGARPPGAHDPTLSKAVAGVDLSGGLVLRRFDRLPTAGLVLAAHVAFGPGLQQQLEPVVSSVALQLAQGGLFGRYGAVGLGLTRFTPACSCSAQGAQEVVGLSVPLTFKYEANELVRVGLHTELGLAPHRGGAVDMLLLGSLFLGLGF